MDLIIIFIIMVGVLILREVSSSVQTKKETERKERLESQSINRYNKRMIQLQNKIKPILEKGFIVDSCYRCNETIMLLETVSPKGKSIKYRCKHCNKLSHTSAINKEAEIAIIPLWLEFKTLVNNNKQQYYSVLGTNYGKTPKRVGTTINFNTPEAIMPYEQTSRKTITEKVRSEIWRRDLGKCVMCGSKNNLQFDHIIPVSKGGATTVINLQILCQSCNQKKGAKI